MVGLNYHTAVQIQFCRVCFQLKRAHIYKQFIDYTDNLCKSDCGI